MKKRWKHSSIMFNFSHWWVSKLFFSLTNWKLKIFIKIIKFYGKKFREFNLLVRNLNWNYLQNSIVSILRGEIFTATKFIVFGNLVFISILNSNHFLFVYCPTDITYFMGSLVTSSIKNFDFRSWFQRVSLKFFIMYCFGHSVTIQYVHIRSIQIWL